jgi:hypothetical protein
MAVNHRCDMNEPKEIDPKNIEGEKATRQENCYKERKEPTIQRPHRSPNIGTLFWHFMIPYRWG